MRSFLIALTRNPLSLLGTAIATASAVLIVTLFGIELIGFLGNPYIGILAYMVLPGIFAIGLALIPVGIFRERRRVTRAAELGTPEPGFPVIDLNVNRTRTWVMVFLLMTLGNVVLLALATFKGVEVMESTEFCGETCHTVMAPEFTAHGRSPHSRVSCVDCHIGPGADWFVKSKLSGAWQVVSVAFDLYPRPIPSPVHDLRPARETCEQCHWPSKFVGDKLRVRTHYDNDEENTELKTVLMIRVGGLDGESSRGIHWHVDPGMQIRYRSDEKRENIYEVELTRSDGTVDLYLPSAQPEDPAAVQEWRVMDCIDCHNRPTHVYESPEDAVDAAIETKRISRSLPFIRREGIRVIREEYASHDEAARQIVAKIAAFYTENHPDVAAEQGDAIRQAGEALAEAFTVNVFPSMNVEWGTYPDHIGHEVTDGCFRCHNDMHETEAGKVISQDCSTCHALLAMEEEDPEILNTLSD
jgi:hypothetical protein